MAKSLYLKGFNSQFNDFMNDLITVYPDKNQFLKYMRINRQKKSSYFIIFFRNCS